MHVTAHLSDPHIDNSPRSLDRFRRVLSYLDGLREPIDAVVLTGDIADHGELAEYRTVASLIDGRTPQVWHCPGNHDVRDAYRRGLLDRPGGDTPINQDGYAGGVRYLLCDATIPGEDAGRLDETTLHWLDESLRSDPDTACYVCFHQPPQRLGYFVDEMRQFGADRLAETLRPHRQVVALLAGHTHTAAVARFAGLPLLTGPGIVNTSNLPWESARHINPDAPPMVAFHLLHDDRRVTTHYRVVP